MQFKKNSVFWARVFEFGKNVLLKIGCNVYSSQFAYRRVIGPLVVALNFLI